MVKNLCLLINPKPLQLEKHYILLLKALMCGYLDLRAQGRGCRLMLCHVLLKMGILLYKMAILYNQKFMTVWHKDNKALFFCYVLGWSR